MQFLLDLITVEFVTWVLVALVFGVWVAYYSPRPLSLKDKHVFITGGSSGIGKAIAAEVIKAGGCVSLFARDKGKLEKGREDICDASQCDPNKISTFSGDVGSSPEELMKIVEDAEDVNGPVFMLVNSAGVARAGKFEDLPMEAFRNMMDVNFMGTVNISKVVVPKMKERNEGVVVLIGSQAGLTGIFGYTAYAATKFALRGFAESLSMEVKPYNVSVTVSCPPDTDTPGLADENKTKPKETFLIADESGVFSAEEVAKKTISDALMKKFLSTNGVEGWLLTTVCTGMAPVTSFYDLTVQVFTMGLCRLISAFYLLKFDRIIKGERLQKEKSKRN